MLRVRKEEKMVCDECTTAIVVQVEMVADGRDDGAYPLAGGTIVHACYDGAALTFRNRDADGGLEITVIYMCDGCLAGAVASAHHTGHVGANINGSSA